jgi:hypothetical protein
VESKPGPDGRKSYISKVKSIKTSKEMNESKKNNH